MTFLQASAGLLLAMAICTVTALAATTAMVGMARLERAAIPIEPVRHR